VLSKTKRGKYMDKVVLCKRCGCFGLVLVERNKCPVCNNDLFSLPLALEEYGKMSEPEMDAYPFTIQPANEYNAELWEKNKIEEARRWCRVHGMGDQENTTKEEKRGMFFGVNFPL